MISQNECDENISGRPEPVLESSILFVDENGEPIPWPQVLAELNSIETDDNCL